jgi:hypothetical protein
MADTVRQHLVVSTFRLRAQNHVGCVPAAAWAFFDDDRHYPEGWEFPIRRTWYNMSNQCPSPDGDQKNVDALAARPSGSLKIAAPEAPDTIESDTFRSLQKDLGAGRVSVYPSLVGKLIPFWQ